MEGLSLVFLVCSINFVEIMTRYVLGEMEGKVNSFILEIQND
jgi:hypothetical protein